MLMTETYIILDFFHLNGRFCVCVYLNLFVAYLFILFFIVISF